MQFESGLPEYLRAMQNNPGDADSLSRAWRNQLLAESDWTQTVDSPLTTEQKAAWATYRQALRDVTAQEGFPTSITWPTAPGASDE